MNKKNLGASRKVASKMHFENLNAYLRKNKRVVAAVTEIKGKNKTSVYGVKLTPVKKIGKNYIAISELKGFEPEVLSVLPEHKYEVSPQVLIFARLIQRIPIAKIKRIGRDISDI